MRFPDGIFWENVLAESISKIVEALQGHDDDYRWCLRSIEMLLADSLFITMKQFIEAVKNIGAIQTRAAKVANLISREPVLIQAHWTEHNFFCSRVVNTGSAMAAKEYKYPRRAATISSVRTLQTNPL